MWTALISPIASLAGSFLEGQTKKQQAKANLALTEAEAKSEILKSAAMHDSKWELIMAESTNSSIKDEVVTIAVLIPVILCFIPGMEDVVKNGFERLSELPEWYTYLLFLTCSAALGIRSLDKFRKK